MNAADIARQVMLSDEKIRELAKGTLAKYGFEKEAQMVALVSQELRNAVNTFAASGLVVVDLAELEAALKGMLAHSCVADSSPNDKAPEDHEAERKARALLAAIQERKV